MWFTVSLNTPSVKETNSSWSSKLNFFSVLSPRAKASDRLSLYHVPAPEVKSSGTDLASRDKSGESEFHQIKEAILGIWSGN